MVLWTFFKDFEYQAKLSVWVSENSPPDLIWVCVCESERTHLPFALLFNQTSNKSSQSDERTHTETLNPDTPKKIPITLSDTPDTEWYRYPEWFFLSLRVLTTHPRVYPWHWRTLVSSQTNWTLSDTHYTEGYPWHWVIPITLSSSQ
jgi:hypothetical protein